MTAGLLVDGLAVAVILAGVLIASWRSRRRSAAERHWLLAAGIVGALALPVVRLAIPAPWTAPLAALRPGPVPAATPAAAPRDIVAVPGDASSDAVATVAVRRPEPPPPWPWAAIASSIWLAGIVVVASRVAAGLLRLRGITARATPIEAGPWRAAVDSVGAALRLRRPVRILVSDESTLVATWGWRRPQILLPRQALTWSADRIRVVAAHELAHVTRGDWRHQLAGEALCALHWWNPLAWTVRGRQLAESERASDDVVLALGVDPPSYAEHLVDLARQLRPHGAAWLPAPAMVRSSSLEGRVLAMLDPTAARRPATSRVRAAIAAAALVVTIPLAVLGAATQFHTVRGSLSDQSGRSLPDAAVVLAADDAGRKYEVRSDGAGRFEFVGLPAGTYHLEVRSPGFRVHREDVVVSADVDRTVRLAVGTLQETITVVGDGQPEPVPDAAAVARRAERLARAGERQKQAVAFCAAGPPTAAGGNILPPLKIVHVNPRYPEHLRPAGVRGTVTMRAAIDRDGAVRDVDDIVASHPDLEAPAVEAVREWKFTATLLNCEPIEVEMTVTVNFSAAP